MPLVLIVQENRLMLVFCIPSELDATDDVNLTIDTSQNDNDHLTNLQSLHNFPTKRDKFFISNTGADYESNGVFG